MTEFWLISAPGEKTCQQTWEKLHAATTKNNNLSTNSKFNIPDLKVGTLDILVGLSDELAKLDAFVEGFQWDMAKYPIKQSLKNISEIIAKGVTQIDNDLKSRASAYNNLKGNLQNLERKNAGSLLTRSLADIVKKEDFVLDSEYLITLVVVVPKSNYNDWVKQYETLSEMVVPRSSNVLSEDQDSYLCNVTLFRKAVDDFRHKAREYKFMVRDFQYNEEEMKADKEEMNRLSTDKKKQFGPLVRWLKVNFSEAFIAWIHVKALRVFVESVLRYGLPVNFQAMLLQPNKKTMKKLREVLNDLYKHLDSSAAAIIDATMDIPGLNLSQQEYYPYVYYKIDCNLLDFKSPESTQAILDTSSFNHKQRKKDQYGTPEDECATSAEEDFGYMKRNAFCLEKRVYFPYKHSVLNHRPYSSPSYVAVLHANFTSSFSDGISRAGGMASTGKTELPTSEHPIVQRLGQSPERWETHVQIPSHQAEVEIEAVCLTAQETRGCRNAPASMLKQDEGSFRPASPLCGKYKDRSDSDRKSSKTNIALSSSEAA
ncbi:V-type proton ATPase subunit C 1 [Chelonia mydas]|uniref:V-type proton ATPase subunit C n=2 Tax=Amniota TaxID=32524 RepID=M7C4A9_CHEMY|nr:V-type proton ATPase subunit C 1 [Chelonia mydas]